MTQPRAGSRNRLLTRMLVLVVVPTALVMLLALGIAAARGFANLRRAAEAELQDIAEYAALEIEEGNRVATITARTMADAQMAGMFGDRRASLEYARRVLAASPEFTGAYFGYEPNADGADAASLAGGELPAKAMTPEGRFIPYWFIDVAKGDAVTLEQLVDMETSLYYQGARDAFVKEGSRGPMITEPYVYQGKMIVEQVCPIIIDGTFRGVAGVDRALAELDRELADLADESGADLYLVSSRGHFIAATTDDESAAEANRLRTRAVAATPYGALLNDLAGSIGGNRSVLSKEIDPVTAEEEYWVAAPIATGDWTLFLRRGEQSIVAPILTQLQQTLTIAFLGLAVVVALVVTGLVRVSRRVNRAADAAERVASGDLSIEIAAPEGGDETNALLRAIAKMTTNLNRIVGGVKEASIRINSTATQLAATSMEQEAIANGFGASATQIAASVKEISATSTSLARTMDEVGRLSSETTALAASGRDGLAGMEATMRGLDEATAGIAARLAAINERTAAITGVVTTINKVADQTNLLSVNAAIEAEKAGEYGVGFLVVAREIRRLADQTAAATLDIEEMVRQMQSAVSTGVMEMDRFADQVRRSVREVAEIGGQLVTIIGQVDEGSARFEQVREGMNAQSEGAEQIAAAMSGLTEGATRTTAAIHESSRAADELRQAIASLKESIAAFRLGGSR